MKNSEQSSRPSVESLIEISDLWPTVERDLALTRDQAIFIVESEVLKVMPEFFLFNPAVESWELAPPEQTLASILLQLRNSDFAKDASLPLQLSSSVRVRRVDLSNIQDQIKLVSRMLPVGSRMSMPESRTGWRNSQMVSVADLAKGLADHNAIPLEQAAYFVWKTACQISGISVYELSAGIPQCLGAAEWLAEFAELVRLQNRKSDLASLKRLSFDPIDAEQIFMQFPFESGKEPISHGIYLGTREPFKTGEETERKIAAFGIKALELEARHRIMLADFGRRKPEKFLRWFCELVVGKDSGANPLRTIFAKEVDGPASRNLYEKFSYLADVILRKLVQNDTSLATPESGKQGESISLYELTFQEMHFHFSYLHPNLFEGPRGLPHLMWKVFGHFKEPLELALSLLTDKLMNGLPLYRYEVGKLARVQADDENLIFLRSCGKHGGMPECYEPPHWFRDYFVLSKELEIYNWLFNFDSMPSEDQLMGRREVLIKQLGITSDKAISLKSPATRMLGIVDIVRTRYWGENFDPLDTDTFPKQKDIVSWLVENHGLSDREAHAIDLVTRPDAARKK